MMTGQDNRDAAEEERRAKEAATPPAPPPVEPADEPPTAAGMTRLAQAWPYVQPWCGPFTVHGAELPGRWLVAAIISASWSNFGYEISWRAGGPGSVVRRQLKFFKEEPAREAAQWEMDRLEKLLADA